MGEKLAILVRIVLSLMLLSGIYEYAPRSWNPLLVFLIVALLSFLVTSIHEMGHAFAIWSQRGTVKAICVFGLTYTPRAQRLSFEPLPRGGDLAGFVRYTPSVRNWTRRQHAFVTAAGPLADAALALLALTASAILSAPTPSAEAPVALVAYDVEQGTPSALPTTEKVERILARESDRYFAPLASMLMVVAFISALGNLLPYRSSDGARLWALWRNARSRQNR